MLRSRKRRLYSRCTESVAGTWRSSQQIKNSTQTDAGGAAVVSLFLALLSRYTCPAARRKEGQVYSERPQAEMTTGT